MTSKIRKPVECDCPEAFALPILATLPGSITMAACVKCGCSALADPIITEDRPHQVEFHGYDFFSLTSEARAWASMWPRYALLNRKMVYLAASARFESEEELRLALEAAAERQKDARLRDILISLGVPPMPPPRSVPDCLNGFVEIWDGLRLNDETPVEELLEAATRFNGPNQLAREVLARRLDLPRLTESLLSDAGEEKRKWGRHLVVEFRLADPEILAPLLARLRQLDSNLDGEMYSILAVLRELGPRANIALPDVEAAAARVQATDYYLHKDLAALAVRMKTPADSWTPGNRDRKEAGNDSVGNSPG